MHDPTGAHPVTRPVIADRYELQGLLGRGGSASVHRAWDRRLERSVAIKVLAADPDETAQRRRRTEIAVLGAVDHPTLVTLLDTVPTPDVTYLVMELVEGGTLRDRIRAGALPPREVAAIGACVADGLAHIHARGVVHRDVKPANILLPGTATGPAAKLSDFGIAKLLELTTAHSTGVIGTAQYLSPEQAVGHVVGPETDVYSLGLTLLQACTGRAPFPGGTAEALAARMLRDPEVPPWLGYEWRSLLTAMTRRDVVARPTAAEAADRLRHLAAERAVGADDPEPTDTVPLAVSALAIAGPSLPVTAPTPVPVAAAPLPPAARPRRGSLVLRLTSAAAALALATGAGAAVALSLTAGTATDDVRAAIQPVTPSPSRTPVATSPSPSARPAPTTDVATASSRTAAATSWGAATARRTAARQPAAPRPAADRTAATHAEHAKAHGASKAAKAKAKGNGHGKGAAGKPAHVPPGHAKGHGRKG